MINKFLKDSFFYAIPPIVSALISLILLPYLTKALSPSDYGVIDLLILFMTLVNLTVAMEVSQAEAFFFSTAKTLKARITLASTAFWFTFACYTVFFFLSIFFSYRLSKILFFNDDLESIFKIWMLYVWINGLVYLIQNQLRFEFLVKHYALISVLSTLITATLSLYYAYFEKMGIYGILYGSIFGGLVNLILGLYCLKESIRFKFEFKILKKMLRFSAPLIPSSCAIFITMYVNRILIQHSLSISDVGIYGIASRIASVAGIVMFGVQFALTPLIYNNFKKKRTPSHISDIFSLFIAVALIVFLMLGIYSDNLIKTFTSKEFRGASELVAIIVPTIFLSNMYIFAPGIMIAKKNYLILLINLFGALLNISLNWIFIKYFGLIGAAFGNCIGYIIIFSVYLKTSQHFYFIPYKLREIIISTIIFALLLISKFDFIFISVPDNFEKILKIIIGIFVLFIFKLVKFSNLKKIFLNRNLTKA